MNERERTKVVAALTESLMVLAECREHTRKVLDYRQIGPNMEFGDNRRTSGSVSEIQCLFDEMAAFIDELAELLRSDRSKKGIARRRALALAVSRREELRGLIAPEA
jgi:hypothetical protein